MSDRVQWTFFAAVIAVLSTALFVFVESGKATGLAPVIGAKVPRLVAAEVSPVERPRLVKDFRGRNTILNIWATWCGPCRQEMPSLNALARDPIVPNLDVMAVSIDDARSLDVLKKFIADFDIAFDVLHDPSAKVAREFGVVGLPQTFVITSDGALTLHVIGARDWNNERTRLMLKRAIVSPASLTTNVNQH